MTDPSPVFVTVASPSIFISFTIFVMKLPSNFTSNLSAYSKNLIPSEGVKSTTPLLITISPELIYGVNSAIVSGFAQYK